jgi:hypothetical protein
LGVAVGLARPPSPPTGPGAAAQLMSRVLRTRRRAVHYAVVALVFAGVCVWVVPWGASLPPFQPRACTHARHLAFTPPRLVAMAGPGIQKLKDQHAGRGEFSNYPALELVEWITTHTPPTAVFAGNMVTTAFVLSLARRPVVNHPHYEHADIRERTFRVYQLYAGQPDAELWRVARTYAVSYFIVEEASCQMAPDPHPQSFRALYNRVQPALVREPPFCMRWLIGDADRKTPLFSIAWANQQYQVLRVTPAAELAALGYPVP